MWLSVYELNLMRVKIDHFAYTSYMHQPNLFVSIYPHVPITDIKFASFGLDRFDAIYHLLNHVLCFYMQLRNVIYVFGVWPHWA